MPERLATKAAIKRGSAQARRAMTLLDREALRELAQVYMEARGDIEEAILGYAGREVTLRLEVLQSLLDDVNARLQHLVTARDNLLEGELLAAARLGVQPYRALAWTAHLDQVADAAARFTREFIAADGLQLSDRIWRIDQQARDLVGHAIQSAVIQGHDASRAAQSFLSRGVAVPPDIAAKMGMARGDRVARIAGDALMKDEGNAYAAARRVFRTELNRAHGEAYMAGGEGTPGFAGWRFLLSPSHPEPDICDMHARANLHGLGPGVYPSRERCPWPAHPNTLSFVEIVFEDEITDQDRAGQVDRLGWLRGQPKNMQTAILGSREKAEAFAADVLKENQIGTPWRSLKQHYQQHGIDPNAFKAERAVTQLGGTQVFGMPVAEYRAYTTSAMAHAPAVVHRVMEKVPPPASVRVVPSGDSYFHGDGLVLARTSMVPRQGFHSEHDVYRHEYGHYVDFWAFSDGRKVGRVVSSTSDAAGGLRDTIHAARRSLDARSAAQKARRERMRYDLIERMDTNLADLFGSLTRNKIGWGHSESYLARPGFAETEVFANLFDIYSRQDRGAWEYLERELPDLAHRFQEVLEVIAR